MQVFFSTPLYPCINTHPNFIDDFHSRALIFWADQLWVHYCANQLGCRDFERPAVMAPGLPSSRYIGFISNRKRWNCRAYLHTGQFKTMCTPMTTVTSHFHHKYFSFPLASSNMALSVKKSCPQQLENTYILAELSCSRMGNCQSTIRKLKFGYFDGRCMHQQHWLLLETSAL